MSDQVQERVCSRWSSAPEMLDFPLPAVLHDGTDVVAVNRQGSREFGVDDSDEERLSWPALAQTYAGRYEACSVELHDDAAGKPLFIAVFHPSEPATAELKLYSCLFESLPMCALELEVGRRSKRSAYRPCHVVGGNGAALALFEAQDFSALCQQVEIQLQQPGFRVCIESTLAPPYQTRECFGLRMVTVSGRELLVRVTSMRLEGGIGPQTRLVLFIEDCAPVESLRLNYEAYRSRLSEFVQTRSAQVELARSALLSRDRLAEVLLEVRSTHTAAHMKRVAVLSEHIGLTLGMDRHELAQLITAARLHDIGIAQVPIEILARSGQVTSAERRVIEEHPENASRILAAAGYADGVVLAVGQHHERYDGSGYPHGLTGEGICRPARVLGVADVVDAMLAPRTYRNAFDSQAAVASLEKKASGFDPDVVAACREVLGSSQSLAPCMADEERAAMCEPVLAAASYGV